MESRARCRWQKGENEGATRDLSASQTETSPNRGPRSRGPLNLRTLPTALEASLPPHLLGWSRERELAERQRPLPTACEQGPLPQGVILCFTKITQHLRRVTRSPLDI